MKILPLLASWLLVLNSCTKDASWMLGPFQRPVNAQPIVTPIDTTIFQDPITQKTVRWESMATFNPAAIVKEGQVYLIYRAEEKLGEQGIGGHTSRLGLAISKDGLHFERHAEPILYPAEDEQKSFEWPGGVEDPRIVETEDGLYVLTYTQWNREYPRLAVATSRDLRHWQKHGPIFQHFSDGKYHNRETKSGAIVTALKDGRLLATKINGKYWMYFGVPHIWLANSEDLIHWQPMEDIDGNLAPVLSPRPGYFDSWLVEAGPSPIITEHGIVVLYNAGNQQYIGDKSLGNRVYTAGQALFSKEEPWKLLARTHQPFLKPELPFEKSGQYVDGTTFIEGLVFFQRKWFLYYGTADSMVGVATY